MNEYNENLKRVIDFTDIRHLCRVLRDEFNMSEDCILAKRVDNKGVLELELDKDIVLYNYGHDGVQIEDLTIEKSLVVFLDSFLSLYKDAKITEQDYHDIYLLHVFSLLACYKEQGGLKRFDSQLVVPSYNDIKLILELADTRVNHIVDGIILTTENYVDYDKDVYTERIKHDFNIPSGVVLKAENNCIIMETSDCIARIPIVLCLMRPHNLVKLIQPICYFIMLECSN